MYLSVNKQSMEIQLISSRMNLKQKQVLSNTPCSTYIQPVNLAQQKQQSGLKIKNKADTQGSVDTYPTESQPSEKMDFEMDTDIIPGEMDKHQLCHKCNGDKPWSPVFRSEKPCDTGRCVWNRTEGSEHIPHTQWMKTEHFKDCSINLHHKLNTHLVNVSNCIKCEQVFPINCDQGARNRRERQLTRFALPYDYTCFADGTPFYIELFGFFSMAPQEKYVLAQFSLTTM